MNSSLRQKEKKNTKIKLFKKIDTRYIKKYSTNTQINKLMN